MLSINPSKYVFFGFRYGILRLSFGLNFSKKFFEMISNFLVLSLNII